MKRALFLGIFFGAQLVFIFAHIHKHTLFIRQSYRTQKNEKLLAQLTGKKQEVAAQLQALKSHAAIKKYAHETLHMRPISLNQIRRLNGPGHDRTA